MAAFDPWLLVRAAEDRGRSRRKQDRIALVIVTAVFLAFLAALVVSAGWAVEPIFS